MWILRGEQFQRWLPSVLSMVAFRLTCLLPCRTSVSDPSSSSRSSLRRSMDCWWRRTGVLDLETLAKRWEKLRNEKTDDQAVLTFKTKPKKKHNDLLQIGSLRNRRCTNLLFQTHLQVQKITKDMSNVNMEGWPPILLHADESPYRYVFIIIVIIIWDL